MNLSYNDVKPFVNEDYTFCLHFIQNQLEVFALSAFG